MSPPHAVLFPPQREKFAPRSEFLPGPGTPGAVVLTYAITRPRTRGKDPGRHPAGTPGIFPGIFSRRGASWLITAGHGGWRREDSSRRSSRKDGTTVLKKLLAMFVV